MNKKTDKIKFVRVFLILCIFSFFVYAEPEQSVGPDSWSLIIYRPDNNGDMNTVRCWLKLEDAETGEDVTFKKAKATYEWVSIPNVKNKYSKAYYLSGGMAMHLILAPGKYRISVCTPKNRTDFFECENKGDWLSNVFEYDTANPTNVIFVVPTINENGFYNGGWYIDYRAPKFYKFTKPRIKLSENK